MNAGDGENDPLGDVRRVVSDAFKILGDHQQVQGVFAVCRVRRDLSDQALLDPGKLLVHNIIRRAANNDILLNICITLTGTIYDERRVLFTHTNYVEQSLWEHNQIANAFGSLDVNQVKQAYIAHLATTRSSIELTQPET